MAQGTQSLTDLIIAQFLESKGLTPDDLAEAKLSPKVVAEAGAEIDTEQPETGKNGFRVSDMLKPEDANRLVSLSEDEVTKEDYVSKMVSWEELARLLASSEEELEIVCELQIGPDGSWVEGPPNIRPVTLKPKPAHDSTNVPKQKVDVTSTRGVEFKLAGSTAAAPPVLDNELKRKLIDIFANSEDPKFMSDLLRSFRETTKVSQRGLAKAMGASKTTVNQMETGKSNPQLETIARYCAALRQAQEESPN